MDNEDLVAQIIIKDSNIFKEELQKIEDEEIRNFTKECLDKAPPHFWYKPASSTGKYHAKDENESGGLVLHTKRVFKAGEILISSWPNPIKADVIRSANLLHDIRKYGSGYSATKYTQSNHPELGAELLKDVAELTGKYDPEKVRLISESVAHHMGKWGKTSLSSHEDLIVHLSDMIATLMYIE